MIPLLNVFTAARGDHLVKHLIIALNCVGFARRLFKSRDGNIRLYGQELRRPPPMSCGNIVQARISYQSPVGSQVCAVGGS